MSIRNFVKTSIGVVGISLIMAMPVHAAEKGVSLGNDVNVRLGADATAEVVTTLKEGDNATVHTLNDNWFEVELEDGTKGFVQSDYISLEAVEGKVTRDTISVRDAASQEGVLLGTLSTGDTVTATAIDGNWLKIEFNGNEAYVFNEYVESDKKEFLKDLNYVAATGEEQLALVTASNGLKFRAGTSTDSAELGLFEAGTLLPVLGTNGDWVKVNHNGTIGYVHTDFVSVKTEAQHAAVADSKGNDLVDYAKKYIGTPYSWGGTSLGSGVDCSGFVYAVFRDHGIKLNRSSRDMASNGSTISKGELEPGDLVFFRTGGSSRINHVGIYTGGSKFVHASSGAVRAVTVSDLNSAYYTNAYYTARRVL